MSFGERRAFITELARESGDFVRPLFGKLALPVELKSDQTPVTYADKGAEELMRQMIGRRFPEDGLLGEEYGAERTDAEFVWVLDPVDGTRSFVTGVPLWGTLIALLHRNQPVLGCIHLPALGQLLIGDGESAKLNGVDVKCRDTQKLGEAILLTTDWRAPDKYQSGPAFGRLAGAAKLTRTWGDCYGYFLVATGWADVMLDPIMNPWDIAALVPIIRGAGGVISDWQGAAAWPAESTVAAVTPALHAEVIDRLATRS